MSTKICPNPDCKIKIAQALIDFKRLNAQGRTIYGSICNTCKRIEIQTLKGNSESLTPVKKLLNKPVWMVIYRSY